MRFIRLIWILVLGSLTVLQAGTAQEVTWTYRPAMGGWIGITVGFPSGSAGGPEGTVVEVQDVVEGSPAAEAGIRVGDTITHLDSIPVSQELFSSLPERLKAGDVVRVRVKRQGRSREFAVQTRERPSSYIVVGHDADRMVVELETIKGNILKNLDSLRLSFSAMSLDSIPGGVRLQILRSPTHAEAQDELGISLRVFEPFADTIMFTPGGYFVAPDFAMPFEAMIVESQATSSLKDQLAKLSQELTTTRQEELTRIRELSAANQGSVEEAVSRDDRLREIRARQQALAASQQELSARLRAMSEEEMQRQWVEVQARSEAALQEARRAQSEARPQAQGQLEAERAQARETYQLLRDRYGSPVIAGQNYMLGAQLAPLTPELAEYFPVDEGVFVVQVMDGTPASDAGLRGGDIIVRVAGNEIGSLSDLRASLGAVEGPLRIRVVRKGSPVEILIQR